MLHGTGNREGSDFTRRNSEINIINSEWQNLDTKKNEWKKDIEAVAYPGIFFGGVQQIQLRTEDREDGDLGAVAPSSGVLEAAVIWYKKFHFI